MICFGPKTPRLQVPSERFGFPRRLIAASENPVIVRIFVGTRGLERLVDPFFPEVLKTGGVLGGGLPSQKSSLQVQKCHDHCKSRKDFVGVSPSLRRNFVGYRISRVCHGSLLIDVIEEIDV